MNQLEENKAIIHEIGAVYYSCNAEGCGYEAKTASNHKTHKGGIHDIDVTY